MGSGAAPHQFAAFPETVDMVEGETPPVTGYALVAQLERRLYFGYNGPLLSIGLALMSGQRPRIVRHYWSQSLRPGPGLYEAYTILAHSRGTDHVSHPVGGLRGFLFRRR